MKIGPEALEPAIRCGATHHNHIPETPAKTRDAETCCATATLTEHRSVNIVICRGCSIPASNWERVPNFGTSSAHCITHRSDTTETQPRRRIRQQPAVAPRTAEDATASTVSQPVRQRATQHRPARQAQEAANESRLANENESAAVAANEPLTCDDDRGRGDPSTVSRRTGQDS